MRQLPDTRTSRTARLAALLTAVAYTGASLFPAWATAQPGPGVNRIQTMHQTTGIGTMGIFCMVLGAALIGGLIMALVMRSRRGSGSAPSV
jgi:hypothetical protein